ncbi:TBC1 domain family member 10B [Lates japonicus]|uniref:TBC1 domain family member 10B n=1 Tax=Lates japonicus TaxID=270547 RepID=A0AAD3M7X0_LATJO|nr:TBC1 domain family member 10B [Lates japonicus]
MAELSTLSPSPPALGDPHAALSIPPSSAALPAPNSPAPESKPKSALYNDKALTGNILAAQSGGSPLTPHLPLSPSKITAETPLPPLAHEAPPQREESTGKDVESGAHVVKQEVMSNDPAAAQVLNTEPEIAALSNEISAQSEVQPASPSPDLNPGPNLYPNVHVTHNPTPVMDGGQFTPGQPQTTEDSNPTPAPAASTNTAASATAEEEKPQPLQQAQNPQSLPPPLSPKPGAQPPPLSPKPGTQRPPLSPMPGAQPPPLSPKPDAQPPPLSPKPDAQPPPQSPKPDAQRPPLSPKPDAQPPLCPQSLALPAKQGKNCPSPPPELNTPAQLRTDKYGFLGGTQYSESGEKEIRVEVARQREMKWIDMFNNWDKWIKHRFQKVKLRCRKGIPSSLRAKAWQLLSNSQELLEANKGKFEELEREQGEAKWLDIIEKDLHRQFPFHEMFAARGGHGQQDLYRILKAYTIYRPDEGYCQAQAPVAAVLLMHMPAEQAFWCLVQICEKYLPGYYSAGLEAIQLDGEIFFSLLRRTCPMAYRHLKKFKIDPILYMTEWFMCIFSRTLPWACVLRVWDMFFCEGVKIVFRVGLVLLKQMLGSVDKLRELQGMYETMERLRNISPDSIREDILVQEVDSRKEAAPVADATAGEEEGKKKKKSKEDKKKEKEDEKKKLKEKKEKEKAEKERLKREKERLEKEKKKGGKKKDKGGGEAEDKNGAAAARDSA